MSRTKRVLLATEDPKPKVRDKTRRCESCGEIFPARDVYQDRDEDGRPLGWLCGGCI